jgi:hypothetical protein
MNDAYFVYYEDDYPEMGGVGFKRFVDKQSALSFIEKRLKGERRHHENNPLDCYTLIKGKAVNLKAIETITKIDVEE